MEPSVRNKLVVGLTVNIKECQQTLLFLKYNYFGYSDHTMSNIASKKIGLFSLLHIFYGNCLQNSSTPLTPSPYDYS